MRYEDFESLISEYLDGALAAERHAAMEGHVATCSACARALSEFQSLDGMLAARFTPPQPRVGFEQRLRKQVGHPQPRWLPWLDAAGYAALAASLLLASAPIEKALGELIATYPFR